MQPHRGTLILVLGILGILVCQLCAPIAWFMGNADLQAIRSGTMDPEGEQLTNAGRILGIVGTILMVISVLVTLAVILVMIGAAASAA